MEIPTLDDRIQNKYADQIEEYSTIFNKEILNGHQHTSDSGYPYFECVINDGEWIHSELFDYLVKLYYEAFWIVEQYEEKEGYCIRIFRRKVEN
ncbi:hypothetical protein MZD04_gp388 [Pseudomonas phage Psa21]|uniref:Uncharacterized protein n=1 Tax=Pseudomonas phage Psa21 TaxID=2530023 RepID=A0A481W6M8_9CAUD|nr:hypothetical protein MZD04_gp388 [Pseudomonas phage Psa21]QBJ02914.1 hypothetical protein PSA21_388 [Pseudomonas phage Psa21]